MDFSFLPKYWPYFSNGIKYTVILAASTVIFALLPAMLLALMRLSKSKIARFVSSAFVEIIRGTPMLVQLYIVFFAMPKLPNYNILGFINISFFIPGVITLVLNSSAYVSEIIRGGILAVDRGQTEAARSLGLTNSQCMISVVIPQAVKNILPALANEFVTIIKESSICGVLGMQELMWGANSVVGATYIPLTPYYLAAALYFCMTFPTSKIIGYFERKMRKSDER